MSNTAKLLEIILEIYAFAHVAAAIFFCKQHLCRNFTEYFYT